MGIVLEAVRFNHDPVAKQSSALNLRLDAARPVPRPEWQRGVTRSAADSVAAYAIGEVRRGPGVRIEASFARDDPAIEAVEIRAVPVRPPELPWWLIGPWSSPRSAAYGLPAYLPGFAFPLWLAWPTPNDSVLGEVAPRQVRFRADGTTEWEAFELRNVRLASRGVGVSEVGWIWQYRVDPGAAWIDIEETRHRIYAVLALPAAPWTQAPADDANAGLPWVAALEVACAWAAGAKTAEDAARRVTESVWALGGVLLEYGCPIGAMETYANSLLGIFNCTAFLDRLRGGIGNGRYVNCTDCATIVTTFANLLGCDLWQSRMGMYAPAFMTEPIFAIGSSRWQSPCGTGLGFNYHEVAWGGACTANDPVWDACLLVDARLSTFGAPVPLLPVGIRFGMLGERRYRQLLAASAYDELVCEPRPWERRRRAVV